MIRKLRLRLTLLVILALLVISAGIVFSINFMNLRNIDADAYAALDILARNNGVRPGTLSASDGMEQRPGVAGGPFGGGKPERGEAIGTPNPNETPPPLPSGTVGTGPRDAGRERDVRLTREQQADLSNYYVATLDQDGELVSWTSDRADLYDDEEVGRIAKRVVAQGGSTGRLESLYYSLTSNGQDGKQLIVLDARLEMDNARKVLWATALVALIAWVLLSAGAFVLIRRMLRPVDEAFEKQKQFVWDASHELKTPLAVISANAEALESDIGDNEWLRYIRSEVTRSDRLVQELLALARMDRGNRQVKKEMFDLSHALLSVALPFESTVFEAGRTLKTEIPDGISYLGDEEMIKELAVILLSNALKYSDEHGEIALSLTARGGKRVITVSNTGKGIAPENREKVFERFFREDATHNSETAGSGLGLSIARSIAEAHGGRISAGGDWGKNAVFTVVL
ncbi:MAG: HAMP domain-containing histidine kinase [Clostridia bacterium]|nr:HAMP domain-containing histidine kinase [Clostridia bacterium]